MKTKRTTLHTPKCRSVHLPNYPVRSHSHLGLPGVRVEFDFFQKVVYYDLYTTEKTDPETFYGT